jgi:hypothetical protein
MRMLPIILIWLLEFLKVSGSSGFRVSQNRV